MTLYQGIANDVLKAAGPQRLRCRQCETVRACEAAHFARYLRDGWPRCCGETMLLETVKP